MAGVGNLDLRVEPATPDRWDDVVAVFGRRGDDAGWCWCRRFLRADGETDNRSALEDELTSARVPIGLIAYVGGEPAGWSRVGPRARFPGVLGNRALQRVLPDDPHAWWVTCFAVTTRYRGQGVGVALLQAVVEHARANGASAVEGHPVDTTALTASKVGGSAIFTGTLPMFASAGFDEIGRTYRSRPVMRIEL